MHEMKGDEVPSDFSIFPNGIYKISIGIADGKDKPKNTASITFFYEKRLHLKNFVLTV